MGSAIEEAVAGADTTARLDIEVTGAQEAEEAAESLSEIVPAATESSSALDSTGSSATITATSMALLPREAKAVQGALGGILTKAGPAGLAIGAVAGLTVSATRAALDADTATRRYGETFGVLGSEIETVDIAGLRTDLGELALQTGSSDDELRQALASIGQFGSASGAAGSQVRQTAEEVLVLANFLAATNPQLGSAEELVGSLTGALGRGGRAAQGFGLNLSAQEVQARAAQIANADLRTEVTQFDRVAAGAAITVERLGPRIKTGIEEGSKNAAVQARSLKERVGELAEELGQPFVEPAKQAIGGLTSVLGLLTTEIGDTEFTAVNAITSIPAVASVALQGVSALITDNEGALRKTIENQAKLPGFLGESSRATLELKASTEAKNIAALEGVAADEATRAALAELGLSFDALRGKEVNFQALTTAQTEMATAFTQSIPTVSASLGQFAADTEINIKKVIADLTEQNNAFANFMPNLKAIIDKGGADLALSIQAMGPQQGAAFAQAVATATPTQIAALEAQTDRRNISINTSGEESGRLSAFAYERGATSSPALQASFQGGKRIGEQAVLGARDGGRGTDQVGRDIGSGLERGLKEKGPSLAATAWSIGQSIKKAFNSIFRNDSPSKVTMAIGRDVSEGLRLGMLQGSSGLGRAATSLGELALPAPRAVAGATPLPALAVGGAATTGGGSIGELHVHTQTNEPQAIAFQIGTEILREASR